MTKKNIFVLLVLFYFTGCQSGMFDTIKTQVTPNPSIQTKPQNNNLTQPQSTIKPSSLSSRPSNLPLDPMKTISIPLHGNQAISKPQDRIYGPILLARTNSSGLGAIAWLSSNRIKGLFVNEGKIEGPFEGESQGVSTNVNISLFAPSKGFLTGNTPIYFPNEDFLIPRPTTSFSTPIQTGGVFGDYQAQQGIWIHEASMNDNGNGFALYSNEHPPTTEKREDWPRTIEFYIDQIENFKRKQKPKVIFQIPSINSGHNKISGVSMNQDGDGIILWDNSKWISFKNFQPIGQIQTFAEYPNGIVKLQIENGAGTLSWFERIETTNSGFLHIKPIKNNQILSANYQILFENPPWARFSSSRTGLVDAWDVKINDQGDGLLATIEMKESERNKRQKVILHPIKNFQLASEKFEMLFPDPTAIVMLRLAVNEKGNGLLIGMSGTCEFSDDLDCQEFNSPQESSLWARKIDGFKPTIN